MFRIGLTEDGRKRVFEAESDTSLVMTGTSSRSTSKHFLITQHDLRIPFEARVNHDNDPATGEVYRYYTFQSFGRLPMDPPGTAQVLLEPQLENFWKKKAAEALVIYGRRYNGLEEPPQCNRVFLEGHFYTRLDFGFTS